MRTHDSDHGSPQKRHEVRVAEFVLLAVIVAGVVWFGVATWQNYRMSRLETHEMTIATPRSFMLSGRITESAPTTDVYIPDAQVEAWAGTRQVATDKTDKDGHYYLQGLVGSIQLRVSAAGYRSYTSDLLAFRDENLNVALTPEPKTVDQTITGQAKPTDPQCYLIHGCQVYPVNAHHDGPLEATLTWPDEDVYLMLQLYVPATGQIITQGQDLFVTQQAISASLAGGTGYQLRVVYENGRKPTTFTLVTTHPN
ncbi:MAG: carboxypeptidase regulatory-like domain-containing protein [Acidobacteriota bacterium]|nr:carboxypeptidase regulatory-like domain-containing protein [Acidobacteriota bacterium]